MGSQLVPRLWQGTPMPHANGQSCASMVKIAHWRLIFIGTFPRPLPGRRSKNEPGRKATTPLRPGVLGYTIGY
jgi:hypothetical protein